MPKLLLIRQGEVIAQFSLAEGGVGIGRSAVNEIQLKSPSVSGRHARIFTTESGSAIKDLSSALGTFVNDRSVTRCNLRNNDVILIGSYKLQFQQNGGGRQPAPTVDESSPVLEPDMAPSTRARPVARPNAAMENSAIEELAPNAQLLVLNGINEGAFVHLGRERLVLGINHGRSLVIELVGEDYMASPLTNASEVALNSAPLRAPAALRENDELLIADIRLRFVSDTASMTN